MDPIRFPAGLRAMLLVAAGAASAALTMPARAAEPAAPVTVLKAAQLFDAATGKLVERGVVVVQGNRILAAGASVAVPAGARVIDLGDATLLPGLIDAHVHISAEANDNYYEAFFNGIMRTPAAQTAFAARLVRQTVEAGITTVRDLGSVDYIAAGLRDAINEGAILGPRILASNYGIGSTGGHADFDPYAPNRIAPVGTQQGICNGPEQCREAVRMQIKYGADVIKFMASGGVLSLTDPVDNVQLTQEEMNAIVSEAHAWGRKAAAHCHGDRAAKMAIAAGVDSIEHGSFLEDDTLRLMKDKHVFLVPTLFALYWVDAHASTLPATILAKEKAAGAHINQMFEHAVKIGTPIAMGTDAGVEPHGKNMTEFWLMTQHGLTAAQSLQAGTVGGAELLGLSKEIGTLEAGKAADVVAVPGNVLANIRALDHPVMVMKGGQFVVGGR
jgi:imidazolonepropionase-like amidohydrolase